MTRFFSLPRLFSMLVASTVVIASVGANAQGFRHSEHSHGHDHWGHHHTPNVVQLDAYADNLAKIGRHLHSDAHELSQDYEHSASIEAYVDRLDRLQQHMHGILHTAVESGRQSSGLATHIKSDVRQVKSLLGRLYGELSHQASDGARSGDFHAMSHMRRIISQEAFPLVRRMEVALYGYALYDHHESSHGDSHRPNHRNDHHTDHRVYQGSTRRSNNEQLITAGAQILRRIRVGR